MFQKVKSSDNQLKETKDLVTSLKEELQKVQQSASGSKEVSDIMLF